MSKGTFLSEKVEKLGIGCSIDAMNHNEIIEFINNLSEENINQCRKIPTSFSINNNADFFNKISSIIP